MELKAAAQSLRDAGYKLTPQRIEVLRVLIGAGTSISAQAILERIRETYPAMSLDTVYRNLTLLTTTGLVNQINLQTKRTALFEFQGERHHHHAICLECGKSRCVDVCPFPETLLLPTPDTTFQVVSHALEIYGYCAECGPPPRSA